MKPQDCYCVLKSQILTDMDLVVPFVSVSLSVSLTLSVSVCVSVSDRRDLD